MKPRLKIKSESHEYPVYIENGVRHETYQVITESLDKPASSYMVIADKTVADLYLDDVMSSFPCEDKPFVSIIPSGEASKSLFQYEQLLTDALERGLDRQAVIIALGGGVTGDLAGFVAATYMRGVRFIQLPSTLLAHDSSVGGKTGVNHPLGKNLIGAFHPPSAVIYDSEMLTSMPEKEWRSGFAEVIKHGFIADVTFLDWLQENVSSFSSCSSETINTMLARSIQVKATIVQEDEREQGVRAFLNFGHTLAHGIEAELGYGEITHGEAVVIGMIFALKLSENYYEKQLDYDHIINYLTELGYDLQIPTTCSFENLIKRMKLDKKAADKMIRFVLLEDIGKPKLVAVEDERILSLLEREGELL
ncbi:3-dehydroquinate synthase [Salipaludibacillus daqingensis]|uniref:3-dehydroquinate synthase n=1 Tax=Salipaludibacillus daqingensis TaxID=3041001 RepID=UPI0024732E95|nr:3-dehydroquinate synthase [Salipaludibacillus daqingensis]